MKVGIISDTHDEQETTEQAIKAIEKKGCVTLIHCGDYTHPFMMRVLRLFKGDVHGCLGNTDHELLLNKEAEKQGIKFHGIIGEIILDNKKIAFTHYPQRAEQLALRGTYNLVCHGHTHEARKNTLNNTILLNPGEIQGRQSKPSYAIYDTIENTITIFEL